MTERLYYSDAYLASFDAQVVARADGGQRIYLNRTAFYPTSGGQPHDLGRINDIAVKDVIDEDARVAHLLESPLDTDAVHGEIDWPRRFDLMQQHTGQHLVSAVFGDRFGRATVSVHFGAETSTLDLEGELLDDQALREAERIANQIIVENRTVDVSFEDAASAAGLRKPPPRSGTIRVITIDRTDRSACGGTHVRRTGEIGLLLLRRQEKIRKATRIEFVCGDRAFARARRDFEALSQAAQLLSASVDDVPGLVSAQAEQLREAQNRTRRLEVELNGHRARERYEGAVPDAAGIRWVVERHADGTPDEWRGFALAYCDLPGAVFVAVSERPPAILLAASSDAGLDAGNVLKSVMARVGGRGGGSPRMAQGSVPSVDALEAVLREVGNRESGSRE
jgi:alanyl-tRNA synthetase